MGQKRGECFSQRARLSLTFSQAPFQESFLCGANSSGPSHLEWLLLLPALSDSSLFNARLTVLGTTGCLLPKHWAVAGRGPASPCLPACRGTAETCTSKGVRMTARLFRSGFCMGTLVLFFLLRIEKLQRKTPNLLLCSSGKALLKPGNSQYPQYNPPLVGRLISPTVL